MDRCQWYYWTRGTGNNRRLRCPVKRGKPTAYSSGGVLLTINLCAAHRRCVERRFSLKEHKAIALNDHGMTAIEQGGWLFPLEGYSQQVRATIEADDGALVVTVEAKRKGLVSERESPWTAVVFGRVPKTIVHVDMWESERWNSEAFIKSLHDFTIKDAECPSS